MFGVGFPLGTPSAQPVNISSPAAAAVQADAFMFSTMN
jgi:hypothetical protein